MNAAEKKAFVFDKSTRFQGGLAQVVYQGREGWLYPDGRLLLEPPYHLEWCYDDGTFMAKKDDKTGIVNLNGDVIIPFLYDNLSYFGFQHGLCWAEIGEFSGFINPAGETVIPFRYHALEDFSEEGYAWANINFMEGIIDRDGNEVIPFLFHDIGSSFEEGWLGISTAEYLVTYGEPKTSKTKYNTLLNEIPGGFYLAYNSQKCNFINAKREILLSEWAENVIYFKEKRAWAVYKNRYDLIDTQGTILHQSRYQDAGQFHQGLASVKKNGKYGFIDPYGQMMITPEFSEVNDFNYDYTPAKRKGKWGLINREGQTVIDFKYEYMNYKSDNFIKVKQGSQYSIINIHGGSVAKGSFDRIGAYSDVLVSVEQNDLIGFISPQTGEMLIPPRYESGRTSKNCYGLEVFSQEFYEGYACVRLGGKWGFIDEQGKPLAIKKIPKMRS